MIEKLVLGTVQMGLDYGINNKVGKISKEESFDILKLAQKAGVSYLDTAAVYGNSEELIGEYLSDRSENPFRIITKLGHDQNTALIDLLEKSLQRLGIETIDSLLFHSHAHYKHSKKQISELKALRQQPFARLGVSVYTNEEILDLSAEPDVDIIQAPFNMLDNESLRGEALKKARDMGKEIHVRSVFLQGLFFRNRDQFPGMLKPLLPHLNQIDELAFEYQLDLGSLALNYVLSKQYIDAVLIGVDSSEQLTQNIDMLKVDVPRKCLEKIDAIWVDDPTLLNPSNWKI